MTSWASQSLEGLPTLVGANFAAVSSTEFPFDEVISVFPGSLPPSTRLLIRKIVLIFFTLFALGVVFAGYRVARLFLVSFTGMIAACFFFAIFRERGAMDFELVPLVFSTVAIGLVGGVVGALMVEALLILFGLVVGGGLGILSLPFLTLFLPPFLRLVVIFAFSIAGVLTLFLHKRKSVIVITTLTGSFLSTSAFSSLVYSLDFPSVLTLTLASAPSFPVEKYKETGVIISVIVFASLVVLGLLTQFLLTAKPSLASKKKDAALARLKSQVKAGDTQLGRGRAGRRSGDGVGGGSGGDIQRSSRVVAEEMRPLLDGESSSV
eukprot:TRINITY_DN683_c1_g1_i2.p1 TRINITY_DN683_c1_g1~~TRINITY_DN683_c1_g1_i2.p1  ORF type:complete len:371 (-),score=98.23 TRINITY_DN683_c1_g1_i2:66-1031(-)